MTYHRQLNTQQDYSQVSQLYRTSNSADDKIKYLDILQKWEKDYLIDFNPDKCEVITMTNKRKTTSGAHFVHNQQLKET